jgi:hypothetical protein
MSRVFAELFQEDDKIFKLDKAPASICETMQADYDKFVQ